MENEIIDPVPIYAALVSTLAFGVSFVSMYLQHLKKKRELYATVDIFFDSRVKGYAQGIEVTFANGGNVGAAISSLQVSYLLDSMGMFHLPDPKVVYDPQSLYLAPQQSTRVQIAFENSINPNHLKYCETHEDGERVRYLLKARLSVSFIFSNGEKHRREFETVTLSFNHHGALRGLDGGLDFFELKTMRKRGSFTERLKELVGEHVTAGSDHKRNIV